MLIHLSPQHGLRQPNVTRVDRKNRRHLLFVDWQNASSAGTIEGCHEGSALFLKATIGASRSRNSEMKHRKLNKKTKVLTL